MLLQLLGTAQGLQDNSYTTRTKKKRQNLANTAWAFAIANLLDEKLFSALARSGEQFIDDFSVQGTRSIPEFPWGTLARAGN